VRVYPSGQAAFVDTTQTDIEQLVLETNQATASIRALRSRCLRLWNQAAHGRAPLSPAQRRQLHAAFRRLLAAAKDEL
jgi:hypothetical protein